MVQECTPIRSVFCGEADGRHMDLDLVGSDGFLSGINSVGNGTFADRRAKRWSVPLIQSDCLARVGGKLPV